MTFLPYLFLFYSIYFVSFLSLSSRGIKKNINTFFIFNLSVLLILCFFCFRGFIFTDWINYYEYYEAIPDNFKDFLIAFEKGTINFNLGFSLYQFLCKKISSDYFFFQGISFFIDFILLYKIFESVNRKYFALNFLFFFLFYGILIEIDLLRNSKSIVFFLYSLRYIYEKRSFRRYCLINIIGILFHVSAVIYIPLYFYLKNIYSRKFYIIVLLTSVVMMFVRIPVATFCIGLLAGVLPAGHTLERILLYMNDEMYSSASVFSFIYLERILSFSLFIAFYHKLLLNSKRNIVFLNIHVLYFISCFVFWDFYIVVQRVSLLFICSYWFIYPEILNLLKRKENKLLFFALLLLFGSYKFVADYSLPVRAYATCFNDMSYEQKKPLTLKVNQN